MRCLKPLAIRGLRAPVHTAPRRRALAWAVALWAIGVYHSLALGAADPDPRVLEAERARIAAMERAAPTVVAVFGAEGGGGGSGVLISPDGFALSNYHVTQPSGTFMKCGLNDGRLYDAVIVGLDPTGDVALIKLLGRTDFPHATLGDSDRALVGDWVFAMGNPFLLAADFQPTVTYGIVSGTHRYQYPAGSILEYTDCLQIDSSINPGNSGGPLFSAAGELIGINGRASFEKRGRVNVGAAYAISINQIKNFLDQLRAGRIVDHGTLGATVGTDGTGRVVVEDILPDCEASRRGLQSGDEIVAFAGRPIRSVNQFKNVLGIYPRGWKLPLTYRRNRQTTEMHVRLRALHRASELTGAEQEAEGPPRRPPGPLPPGHPELKAPPPPAELAQYFLEKRGFANYHFNQLEQRRVLAKLPPLGPDPRWQGVWTISGQDAQGTKFTLKLGDKQAGLILGDQAFLQEFGDLAELRDEPPGTGGLLVALRHLQVLLREGPAGFSEFYYRGTEPLDVDGRAWDVVVGELFGAESAWYIAPDGTQVVAGIVARLESAEPCELRFSEFVDRGGIRWPNTVRVLYLDREVLRLDTATVAAAGGK